MYNIVNINIILSSANIKIGATFLDHVVCIYKNPEIYNLLTSQYCHVLDIVISGDKGPKDRKRSHEAQLEHS